MIGNDLISVIIPVYNVEQYLVRCLDSVINQTYKKLEIILIDDGSIDKSSLICDSYAKKDERIVVIHKENGGLSDARNRGMDVAKGSYIAFIDSDDFVSPDYIEYLYNILKNNNADVSCCDFQCFVKDVESSTRKIDLKTYSGIEAIEQLCYQKTINTSAWGKLYKTELFNSVRFPKGRLYEDLGTTYKVFYKSNKIINSSDKKYYYFLRGDSIMRSSFSLKNFDRILLSNELLNFINENAPSIKNAAISRFFISNVQVFREIPLDNDRYKNEIRILKNNIKKYRKNVFFDKKAKKISRLIALSSYCPEKIFQFLGELYKKKEYVDRKVK